MRKHGNEDRLLAFFALLSADLSLASGEHRKMFAVSRLLGRMRKRAELGAPGLSDEAIAKFCAINSEVGSFVVNLDPYILNNAREFIANCLERYTKTLDPDSIQQALDMRFLNDNWRFGPGASNGVTGTHAVDKVTQKFTCTDLARPLVTSLRMSNPYFQAFDAMGKGGITEVSGSRLTTVPKNESTERTIAIEPIGNMALQLAAGRYLENALRYIGLDISSQQPKNKLLAMQGSIDGSVATLDLASASDRIHPDLVRLLMPAKWYNLLMQLRSPCTTLPDKQVVALNMISTMGNGFTFPLMTLILTSLVYANRCALYPYGRGRRLWLDWKKTCVFGDDIIVPTEEFKPLVSVLESAGFAVNVSKSFGEGPFRESCGGDYYEGYDVTPFYVKRLSSKTDIYVALNQLLLWAGRHQVVVYRSMKYLYALLDNKVFLVPEWMNPDQGLLSASCPRRYKYLKIASSKRLVKSSVFDLMLAIGGYIEESDLDHFYTPRNCKMEVRVKDARLPSGYLDGWSPDRGPAAASSWVSLMVNLLK